jgi:hypothetical protein
VSRLVVIACVLSVSCSAAPSLSIQLVTDLAPGREFDEVEITILPEGEARSLRTDAERNWGRGVRVATIGGLPVGSHEARVTIRLAGSLVQQQSRRLVTGTGPSTVTILITRDCTGVTCSPDQACARAECVSVECTPENPDACPASARCTAGACGAPMGCLVPECRPEGFCFSAPEDALCAQTEYCDAVLGCVPRGVPIDAALVDAGVLVDAVVPVDATMDDAGPPSLPGTLEFPWNGAITSVTPDIRWTGVPGATEHQLVIDDSCDPLAFDACAFPSPELDRRVSANDLIVPALAVSTTAPVGRRYFVHVRPCNAAGCGGWSSVRYFDAGRVRGDVNGDGFSDVIVGAPGTSGEGGAYVLFGGAGGVTGLSAARPISSSGFSPDTNDLFGSEVAFVGDLNADGCADFAVGAPGGNTPTVADVGMLHLYFGSTLSGPSAAIFGHTQISPGIPGARFGGTVAGVGDVDRDGLADVAIGAIGETGGGAVYVLFGRDRMTGATTRIPPPSADDLAFGTTIAGVSDGSQDFSAFEVSTNNSPGRVYGFGVPVSTLSTTPIGGLTSPREEALDGFGGSIVASCDLDADGLTDSVVGSPAYRGAGTVIAFFAHGTIVPLDSPSGGPGEFGTALACADMTGDGIDDLLATSVGEETVTLYAGGSRMLVPTTGSSVLRTTTLGFSATAGFDYDGDGASDALFGAPAGASVGQIVVVLGPWTTGTMGTAIDSGSGMADQFGYALASAPP